MSPAKLSASASLIVGSPDLESYITALTKFRRLVKAAEKQKRRREAAGGAQQPGSAPRKPNLNMVFGGPPGTGKTSTVEKIAKVLAAPEVGVLKYAKVVELNKETPLPKGHTVPERVGKIFESAKGCILFLDEAHKRTDSSNFVDALIPLLSKYEGEVIVVIAGYKKEIMTWLRNSNEGMSRRFPENNHIDFESLNCEVLVEIGQNRLKERHFTLSTDAAARRTFEIVMRYVADKDPPENAAGAINAVDAMINTHDARGDDDDDDDNCCITATDIQEACPKPFEPAAAAAAPAAAAAAAAAEATAGGARRSSMSSSQASSSAAVAGPSTAEAAAEAASDSEEAAPLSKRAYTDIAPSKSAAPAPASSRKRRAESDDPRADVDLAGLSSEVSCLLQAIDKRYTSDEKAFRIPALVLLRDLAERVPDGDLATKLEGIKRVGAHTQRRLRDAFSAINERNGSGDIVRLDEDNKTWYAYGLRFKK